ncbi:N-acetylmuramate alpha-1-phosphate uridylyltransferase [Marinobacter nanhaiticus D15-8W]|uniref:Nucleotidyltransferase family protein n=1 Tax=Marinobacter nanhaiticus D15-8W TaxID=626887 RepID=N6WVZ6_9GAMM|nr:nucleotidyltransferase family protein [Marinobacter nanhaiticus]ENO15716.1 nucleotidyltransferase family protein [Marinobacter nanhaiticus D15-8W]BES73427.1 N-acetylmuramate alpha-1-phosphate uridylyltransferase [Marinobacter nanhaiticus D15-8W]
MKAMILAAGKGERMRPLTLETPKPLLEAGGKPLIVHQIEKLARAGFRDLVVNPSWLGDKLQSALGDGRRYGVNISYSPEPEALETAGGIRQALPMLVDGGDWFLVVNGDIWTDFDFARLEPSTDDQAVLVLTDNPAQHPAGDFHLDSHNRVRAEDQPRLTFTGISLLHRSLFEHLEPGHRKLAPILREAMAKDTVAGIYHGGEWEDIGTPQRLAQLDQQLRQSPSGQAQAERSSETGVPGQGVSGRGAQQ